MKEKCKVCDGLIAESFTAKVLKKYDVSYYTCNSCQLIQADSPYWLDEAYSSAISNADTGIVMRNLHLAAKISGLLYFYFDKKGSFLDAAGGYGIFTRIMRDIGFDYYWDDIYCKNILAPGFEFGECKKNISAITAFEVMEHVRDPLAFIKEKMSQGNTRTLIVTTELYSGLEVPSKNWWYYMFNTGQHISFYSKKTFEKIAENLGLNFYSINGIHILTDKTIKNRIFLKIITGKLAPLIALYVRKKQGSLTVSDHSKMLGS